jgi:hypothetical protein
MLSSNKRGFIDAPNGNASTSFRKTFKLAGFWAHKNCVTSSIKKVNKDFIGLRFPKDKKKSLRGIFFELK